MKTKLSFVALLCMVLLCIVSCKKDDPNGGDTPNPTEADFFIDVDFLPKTETNGEVAPRMIVNFNNEMVMLEIRPSADTLLETMLFICPDNEAMMVCGNENLMICAAYDMETYTASDDVLLVTQMDDNTLLLTQCVMDWNTNTMTTGDMMVLPIDDESKSYRNKGGNEDDFRILLMNGLMTPIVKKIEKAESITGTIGLTPAAKMFSIFKYVLSTSMPIMLFSDDPELLMDYMEYPFVTGIAQGAQKILLRFAPKEVREMASCLVSALGLFTSDGYGNTNVQEEPPMSAFFEPASKMTYAAAQVGTLNPEFAVYLNISDITENSVYVKGSIEYGINHIMPVEMGYAFKLSGGPEHIEEDMGFQGKTITGIQKANKYTIYAYARSLDKLVKSPAVTFWTLGFEAFPNSLTFPAEGDTKYTRFIYSPEDITGWEITSKPSWCNITMEDLKSFAVTVDASTETRSGIISVIAHSKALGTLTENISVTQLGSAPSGFFTGTPFDNTSWNVSYTMETMGTRTYRESEYHYVPNGGSYYTYYNETQPVNESSSGVLSPSFKDNALCLSAYQTYEFKGDSIIIKEGWEGEYYTLRVRNNVPFNTDNGTVTYSRYFVDDNIFRIKEVSNWTSSYYGDDDYWIIWNIDQETTYEFKILNNNQCTFSLDGTLHRTSNYGSEYCNNDAIQEDLIGTGRGTGTYEYGVKNNVINQEDDLNDLMFVPGTPMKRNK